MTDAGIAVRAASGLMPREVLEQIWAQAYALQQRQADLFRGTLMPALDANGNITETNDLTTLKPLLYANDSVFAAKPSTQIKVQANVAAGVTGRQHVGLPFVDAGGNTRTLDLGFNSDPANAANWTLDMSSVGTDNKDVSVTFTPPNVSFDTFGRLISPTNGVITAKGSAAGEVTTQMSRAIIDPVT